MINLKPCPFCGCPVHWERCEGIVHDRLVEECWLNSAPFNGEINVDESDRESIETWWNGSVGLDMLDPRMITKAIVDAYSRIGKEGRTG